jgi:hypothetical protein
MNRTIIIKTDGSEHITEYDEARVALKDLQDVVGGYIEAVPYFEEYESELATMYCDEEGKLKGYPVNLEATKLWADAMNMDLEDIGDLLCGDCIIVTGTRKFVYGD